MPPESGPGTRALLDAVLFDMDGTLVDTEPLWHEAEIDVMAAFGSGWTKADQEHSLGGPMARVAEYMADRAAAGATGPRPDPARVLAELLDAFERRLLRADLRFHDGARLLQQHAREAGLLCAVVSNSPRRFIDPVLAANPDEPFDFSVGGDEVLPNKPHPTPYLTAAEALGVDIRRCLVVEDSPTGVAAGRDSGAYVLAIGADGVHDPGSRVLVVTDIGNLTLEEISRRLADLA